MATGISPISQDKFTCELCSISCARKTEWLRHIQTKKHLSNKNGENSNGLATSVTPMECECGKSYNDRTGLWRHKKKCGLDKPPDDKSSQVDTNLVFQLIKQNDDFKNLIIDQTKIIMEQNKTIVDSIKHNNNTVNSNNTTNNVNSNNQTFNLNLFLHEKCKDAMDLSEFLESIKIQLADVMSVGELGYVDGISKLIIQNLNALDVTKRPVHCTDEKREVIYIKEAGVWTKDEDNSKLRRLVKTVSNRNFRHTRLYKEKYPDCRNPDSKYSDVYVKLVLEATGGGSKYNDYDSENKIMKKIAKVITIDKSEFLTNS
jgi:hypothetical protein